MSIKKTGLLALALSMAASAAFATSFTSISLNGGYDYLHECGGTIQATASENYNGSDAINIVMRGVQECSNFVVENTGRSYKIPGQNGNRTGSISISAGALNYGVNTLRLIVGSNSGLEGRGQGHRDEVSVRVVVTSKYNGGGSLTPNYGGGYGPSACEKAAKGAAQSRAGVYGMAWATYEGTSNSGNYKYSVTLQGAGSYQVVTSPSCEVKNVQ